MKDEVFKIGDLDWKKRADALGKKETQGMRVDIRVLWRIRSTGTLITSAQVLGGCKNHVGKVS